jgi:hypothetical protein
VLTIDIGGADSMQRKEDLYIKVYNSYDGFTVCESKLVDHIADGDTYLYLFINTYIYMYIYM